MPLHIKTPLLPSSALSRAAGRSIVLKMEALQPSGSFKLRGIGHACETYKARGAQRFIASSGGNAGLAVAYAGRALAVPVTVVVPETTPLRARQLLDLEGAEVIVQGASWQEANERAQSMIGAADAFIHPFDNPLLWEGHASMIDEVAESGARPDSVVLSVGGGGLLSGVVEGLQRNGWGGVPVVAVETHGAASLGAAAVAGERVTLDAITTIATSLGAKQICARAFDLLAQHPILPVQVSDAEALEACARFLDDHRVLVEPACGASLALAYGAAEVLAPFSTILMIVCGGSTMSLAQLQEWQQRPS
jgi:L-serine/L-threonine ammonia-lyase